jgi:hypothetical protein
MSVNLNISDFPFASAMSDGESFGEINLLLGLSDKRISESARRILFKSQEDFQDAVGDFEIDDPEGLLISSFLNIENVLQRNISETPQQIADMLPCDFASDDLQPENVFPDFTGILGPGYYRMEEFFLSYLCQMNVITSIEKMEIMLAFLREMQFKIHPVDCEEDPAWISDWEIAKYIPENLKVFIVEFDKWIVANAPGALLLSPKYMSSEKKREENKGKISIWDQEAIIVYNAGLILAELFPNLKRDHPVLYHATKQVDYKKTSIASTIEILENVKAKWNWGGASKEFIINIH